MCIRDSALVKISINPDEIKDIEQLVAKGNCKILDDDPESMILELSGNEKIVEENIKTLKKLKERNFFKNERIKYKWIQRADCRKI